MLVFPGHFITTDVKAIYRSVVTEAACSAFGTVAAEWVHTNVPYYRGFLVIKYLIFR